MPPVLWHCIGTHEIQSMKATRIYVPVTCRVCPPQVLAPQAGLYGLCIPKWHAGFVYLDPKSLHPNLSTLNPEPYVNCNQLSRLLSLEAGESSKHAINSSPSACRYMPSRDIWHFRMPWGSQQVRFCNFRMFLQY